MANRLKKKTISNVTLDQAQEASETFAVKWNSLAKLQAKMNEDINRVRSKYTDELTELQDALKEPQETLEAFAKEQKTGWSKKSMELVHTTIGFRIGNPKVVKGKRFTWDGVLDLVKKNKVLAPLFVRTKEELNKEAILATKDTKILDKLKDVADVTIEQEECFYVEAKVEELVTG
jgi:phage host-nuclease inhibitor protein Gam